MADDPPPGQDAACYCYCVVSAQVALKLDDLAGLPGGEPPRAVRIRKVRAVVSDVRAADYCEETLQGCFQRTDWVEAAVLGHERVVEGCLGQAEVVPMKFCTVFRSERDLVAALAPREDELVSRLLELRGKQEWGIRLRADRRQLERHLLETDPDLVGLRGSLATTSTGAGYFLKKRLEDRVARSVERSIADAAEAGYARLAAASAQSALLRSSSPAPGDGTILNAAFLVTEGQLRELLRQAEQMVSERPWLECEQTGPWPPYNFV